MQFDTIKTFVKRHAGIVAMGSLAAVCLVSFTAYALLPDQPATDTGTEPVRMVAAAQTSEQAPPPPRMLDSGAPFSFAPLVERVSPAVVSVTAEEKVKADAAGLPPDVPAPFREFFRQFGQQMPQTPPRKASSMGSGFIIDAGGLIVTNNHVIDGATKIKVKLTDGRILEAKLIGTDPATDVALLKVKADKPLPTVEFGNDRALRVGDWVVAVGNPFGLTNTVTAGIVSSINRDDINNQQPYTNFIQIDAPINQGNSGGPTFDLRGQVIGMNSMIVSPSGGSVGIGFAIPASTVRDVVAQLQAHGKVTRGWLGVLIQSLTPEMADSLGIKNAKGAIIAKVVEDSPAAKAGLKKGDVIVTLDGKPLEDNHDVTRKVAMLPTGKSANFGIIRDGKRQTVKVVIAPRKEQSVASLTTDDDASPQSAATGKAAGLSLSPLTDESRQSFRLTDRIEGVLITKVDPDSDAAEKGIRPGDVVISVGNREVRTPQDVEKLVAQAKASGRTSVLLLVASGGNTVFVPIEIGKS